MPYEKLLSEGRIKKQSPRRGAVRDLLSLAERDARVAVQTLEAEQAVSFARNYLEGIRQML